MVPRHDTRDRPTKDIHLLRSDECPRDSHADRFVVAKLACLPDDMAAFFARSGSLCTRISVQLNDRPAVG